MVTLAVHHRFLPPDHVHDHANAINLALLLGSLNRMAAHDAGPTHASVGLVDTAGDRETLLRKPDMYLLSQLETGDREAFHHVVAAYRVLCDPVRRAAYDRDTFGTFAPPPSNGSPPERELSERRAEDERDLRRQLLQALYNVRRTEPHRPSLPLMVIPDLFGCSIDEAQFTLWYLRGKKFIEMTDDGMAITVAGVDYVESHEFGLATGTSPDPALGPGSFMLGAGD